MRWRSPPSRSRRSRCGRTRPPRPAGSRPDARPGEAARWARSRWSGESLAWVYRGVYPRGCTPARGAPRARERAMTTDGPTVWTEVELLENDPVAEPLVLGGYRCHRAFDADRSYR